MKSTKRKIIIAFWKTFVTSNSDASKKIPIFHISPFVKKEIEENFHYVISPDDAILNVRDASQVTFTDEDLLYEILDGLHALTQPENQNKSLFVVTNQSTLQRSIKEIEKSIFDAGYGNVEIMVDDVNDTDPETIYSSCVLAHLKNEEKLQILFLPSVKSKSPVKVEFTPSAVLVN